MSSKSRINCTFHENGVNRVIYATNGRHSGWFGCFMHFSLLSGSQVIKKGPLLVWFGQQVGDVHGFYSLSLTAQLFFH